MPTACSVLNSTKIVPMAGAPGTGCDFVGSAVYFLFIRSDGRAEKLHLVLLRRVSRVRCSGHSCCVSVLW